MQSLCLLYRKERCLTQDLWNNLEKFVFKQKEMISNMMIEERKLLEINKSTLWYIQKNLAEKKIHQIYKKILLKIQ